ncbi:MAG: M28 family metallopeptidase [Actinomycetota bacterium]|nr:M28 family metallopeptidase [Actinomycetota bacterium]
MASVPPRTERRRARPGSLQRPVNGRLYRGTWLLVGLPLLMAAFSVARPTPLPRAFLPAFDGEATKKLADDLATNLPNRYPGRLAPADWFRDQIQPYGLLIRTERFSAVIPGRGKVELQNLVAEAGGRSPRTIVVMAHRDNDGRGPGANDNASGTAMLIQLARAYGVPPGLPSGQLRPNHTILFLSTDGGAFGGVGAAWFATHSPLRHDVAGVINLDSVGGSGRIRVEFGGDTPREPSGTFLQTIAARVAAQTGRAPARPAALRQLIDLGFPFSLYEQAPFLAQGIAAVTLTTAGDNPPNPVSDTKERLRADKLSQVGRAAQDALGTLDQGLEFTQGTSTYLYLGSRLIRGWAVELVLIACLLPFLATAIDLFARCRRRHIALAPALRAYRSRLALWAWVAGLFELFRLLGTWPDGAARPIPPTSPVAHDWPAKGLLVLAVLALLGWLVARERLIPRRAITSEEELAGHTASLLCLGALSLLVVATNPFALVFLLPSLHAWLWLPQVRGAPVGVRLGVLALGFAGPALLLGSFAGRFGLGWDAPWYLAELRAVGYVPFVVMPLLVVWLAGTGQLAALATRRYAPYPAAAELPPSGPLRKVVRRTVLTLPDRRRHTSSSGLPEVLEG